MPQRDWDNPLIRPIHITDFWGVDEGVELYGSLGMFSYCVGGAKTAGCRWRANFNKDKFKSSADLVLRSVAWLHMSVSAMRTGAAWTRKMSYASELCSAGGWFRSIGLDEHHEVPCRPRAGRCRGAFLARTFDRLIGGYRALHDNRQSGRITSGDFLLLHGRRRLRHHAPVYGAARFSQILRIMATRFPLMAT